MNELRVFWMEHVSFGCFLKVTVAVKRTIYGMFCDWKYVFHTHNSYVHTGAHMYAYTTIHTPTYIHPPSHTHTDPHTHPHPPSDAWGGSYSERCAGPRAPRGCTEKPSEGTDVRHRLPHFLRTLGATVSL